MRIVFAGTPEFAVGCLDVVLELAATGIAELVGVYSQPDRPAGRGRKLQASPVKARAVRAGVSVHTPETLRTPEAQAELRALAPDVVIVVAYGLILPKKVLAIPRWGCWNVHASLLPRWRGAAPIQRAIEAGDAETGVCLMRMEAGLDTGPVYLRASTPISADDTATTLHDHLAKLGADVLRQGIQQLHGSVLPEPEPQAEVGVLYAHKLDKLEAKLDWSQSALILERKVRAFNPFPVAEAQLLGERVQIHQASMVSGANAGAMSPGQIHAASKHGIDVICGEGILRLSKLKREGGGVISAADYLNARPELKRSLTP